MQEFPVECTACDGRGWVVKEYFQYQSKFSNLNNLEILEIYEQYK